MELLGEGGVTEKNLMQYLGVIEQRTNEILQVGWQLSSLIEVGDLVDWGWTVVSWRMGSVIAAWHSSDPANCSV